MDRVIINTKEFSDLLITCLNTGNKILVCGNGGSAAQAMHFSAELIGRFETERQAFPCICLNTDQSILTAIGNDYGFDRVFARQVEALGRCGYDGYSGDILILITTSGNSENLILAADMAKTKGVITIALSGRDGGKLITDYRLIAHGKTTARIQENHLRILHQVCRVIDTYNKP